MGPLRLIGAGGHGKVVADIAALMGYDDIVFLDQDWPQRTENGAWPVVGHPDQAADLAGAALFVTVGQNAVRAQIWAGLDLTHAPVLVHPSAVLSAHARIGPGTVVMAGAVVNADADIGAGVILNTGASVDHDCRIGDFAHISPGARLAGGVTLGARTWIGIGAAVREGITIGQDVMVGAGSAVVADLPDGARVGGVPAEPL